MGLYCRFYVYKHNQDFHHFYSSPDIIRAMRNIYKTWPKNRNSKYLKIDMDNIKIYLKEIRFQRNEV